MTHRKHHTMLSLTLALTLGVLATPLAAQKTLDAATASCSGLETPLQRELKKTERYLQRVPGGVNAQEARSRLIFKTLQSDEVETALSRVLACLMSTTRQTE